MRVYCLMVSEGRAPICGVSLASFKHQDSSGAEHRLAICVPCEEKKDYAGEVERAAVEVKWFQSCDRGALQEQGLDVADRIDNVCRWIFGEDPDAIITMWDDDDYSPPSRLARTVSAISQFHPRPVVASYDRGYFLNARTFDGSLVEVNHLWGGCLAFNKRAFDSAGGFEDRPCPGYDRGFVDAAVDGGARAVVIDAHYTELPIALIHGRNVATFPRGEMKPMDAYLRKHLPADVMLKLMGFKEFCIRRRIFPPGSGGDAVDLWEG